MDPPALDPASTEPASGLLSDAQDEATLSVLEQREKLSKANPPLSEIQLIAHAASPPAHPAPRLSAPTNALKRTSPFQFGTRTLSESDDVFAWNAWDHVDPSTDTVFIEYAAKQYAFQREHAASDWDRRRFNAEPQKWWDRFYGNNNANFFKDRKWLRQEFPVLEKATGVSHAELVRELAGEEGLSVEDALAMAGNAMDLEEDGEGEARGPWDTVLEIGAGAGNTAFPLVRYNRNPKLMVYALDFSKKAVEVMKQSELYDERHIRASQWDMASANLPEGVQPGSVDAVVMVFVFSALSPRQWEQAVRNVWTVLRPGGEVCFRDYGRGDLAQVRFKKGRWLGENFYARGDGTRVYFFEEDELRRIWSGEVKQVAEESLHAEQNLGDSHAKEELSPSRSDDSPRSFRFEILKLGTDRRLLVNRQKQLKMYRCWMQGRFRKPFCQAES